MLSGTLVGESEAVRTPAPVYGQSECLCISVRVRTFGSVIASIQGQIVWQWFRCGRNLSG